MDDGFVLPIKIDKIMKRFFVALLLLSSLFSCRCKNKLTVDFGKLNPNDFEIYYFTGPEWAKYDIELYNPVYKDGVFYDIQNEKAGYRWSIIYKRQQQCRFYHLILNSRRMHKYKFKIYKNQDSLYCKVKIKGKYKAKQTFQFTEIDEDWETLLKEQ